jgi:hypothetical protein
MGPFKDIGVDIAELVATIEIRRPPHNYFDIALIREIATALEALDDDPAVRCHRAGRAGQGVLRRRQARRRRRCRRRAAGQGRQGPSRHALS